MVLYGRVLAPILHCVDINWLLDDLCSEADVSSVTLSADVGGWTQTCYCLLCSSIPVTTRATEAWLVGNSDNKTFPASFYTNESSPPLIVGRSQFIGGAGNGYGDFAEPASGFSDDTGTVEIHRPAQLKPHQKRRPSRGICYDIAVLLCWSRLTV